MDQTTNYVLNVTGVNDLDKASVSVKNFSQNVQASNQSLNKLGSARFGQGLLQATYAIDDLQYGLKGIVNNIAPLVIGLTGSAGLAAGFTVAAIGANFFASKLGLANNELEEGEKRLEKYDSRMKEIASVQERFSKNTKPTALVESANALNEAIKSLGGSDQLFRAFQDQLINGPENLNFGQARERTFSVFKRIEEGDQKAFRELLTANGEIFKQLAIAYEKEVKKIEDKKFNDELRNALERIDNIKRLRENEARERVRIEEAVRKVEADQIKRIIDKNDAEIRQKEGEKGVASAYADSQKGSREMNQTEFLQLYAMRASLTGRGGLIGSIGPNGELIRTLGQERRAREFYSDRNQVDFALERKEFDRLTREGIDPVTAAQFSNEFVNRSRANVMGDTKPIDLNNQMLERVNDQMAALNQTLKTKKMILERRR